MDCPADDKRPSQSGKRIPANTATTERRTDTLPSAESWHPLSIYRLLRDFLLFHVGSNYRRLPRSTRNASGTLRGFSRLLPSIDRRGLYWFALRPLSPGCRV